VNRQQADLRPLVQQVAERLQAQAVQKGIAIHRSLPDVPVSAWFDPGRIEQVLVNLLDNALKFTPIGGSVTVGVRTDGQWATVWVRDTGQGLEPEELVRVFERFYKGDRSRSATGSGLGLAIAKHLVQIHGGRIWAESTYGAGATFSFTVPVADDTVTRGRMPIARSTRP
jgi:two-component system phosphate regulon sensor histidine kinase PhoR